MSRSAVIVGASGGIGRALATALVARGERVHVLSRRPVEIPGAVSHEPVDVTDESTVAAAAAAIGTSGPVDLVIVATGILHAPGIAPEKTIRSLDPGALARLMAVNAAGPALVAKHFLPLLPRRGPCVFAALSARVGSIADNRLGGWYGYRASKAALNQILRTLAIEVGRGRPEAVVLALHPGTVATSLSGPFRASERAGVVTPEAAAANLLAVIDRATPDLSGRLLAWDGQEVPP